MIDINEIRFERTVWAERQLAKLCPNNNIQKFQEVLATEDTTKQFDALEDMILILHQAYERKMKFLGKKFEPIELTRDILECFNEEDLAIMLEDETLDTTTKVTVIQLSEKINYGKGIKSFAILQKYLIKKK